MISLPAVTAEETSLPDGSVQFHANIEPLVRFLEETPRSKLLERVAERIRGGLSYRDLLAATLLAGIRNVQPRPAVGFKFHCVLVIYSAHQASMASPNDQRWLPLLWAVDYFKRSQAQDLSEGNWTMAAVDDSRVPSGRASLRQLRRSLDQWDVDGADVAAAGAARNLSTGRLLDTFARYGSRDYRNIGHKAIYVAGAFRTLEVIGPEHAEPVMRSLSYALLNHSGEPNPAESDLMPDRDGRENDERVERISAGWLAGKRDDDAAAELLTALRSESSGGACDLVVEMIQRGIHPSSVYDGLFLAASELVTRQPAIVPLHCVTTTNAMHYLFRSVTDDRLRRWILLQNTAFVTRLRDSAKDRDKLPDRPIDRLAATDSDGDAPSVESIFAEVRKDRAAAAGKMLAYLQSGGSVHALMQQARECVFLKGDDSHDYKFSSAVLEDYSQIGPAWRDRYLAGCSYLLRGDSEADTKLAMQARSLGV